MALLEKMPTNARIATALIQVLGESGDVGGRARALRSVGPEGGGLRAPDSWIQENALREMFRSLPADSKLARRVGRALVTPAETGLFLCFSGVATSEKAYRRCDQLLARESREARYEAAEISSGRARIVFHPAARQSARQSLPEPLFCSVRQGMLEAIPLLFGLLPAVVRETECAARGAEQCVFEVSWSRSSRVGLASGILLGSAAGAAFGFLALPGSAGWVPVLTDGGKQIKIGDMFLAEMPERKALQRKEHYRRKTADDLKSVHENQQENIERLDKEAQKHGLAVIPAGETVTDRATQQQVPVGLSITRGSAPSGVVSERPA